MVEPKTFEAGAVVRLEPERWTGEHRLEGQVE